MTRLSWVLWICCSMLDAITSPSYKASSLTKTAGTPCTSTLLETYTPLVLRSYPPPPTTPKNKQTKNTRSNVRTKNQDLETHHACSQSIHIKIRKRTHPHTPFSLTPASLYNIVYATLLLKLIFFLSLRTFFFRRSLILFHHAL